LPISERSAYVCRAVRLHHHAESEHLVELVALFRGEALERFRRHLCVGLEDSLHVPFESLRLLPPALEDRKLPLCGLVCSSPASFVRNSSRVMSPSAAMSWKPLRLRSTSAILSSHAFASRSGSPRRVRRSRSTTLSRSSRNCSGFVIMSETNPHTRASSSSARRIPRSEQDSPSLGCPGPSFAPKSPKLVEKGALVS